MARRIVINNILNLIKEIGGNPNKFMGTKSNINFLGKGPKETLFQGQIDIDGMVQAGFPIERIVGEAERAGGYVTANKLNDFQLQRLETNLAQIKKAYFPEQVSNITDLGTRTGGLTQEGLGSLRTKQFNEKTGGWEKGSDWMKRVNNEVGLPEGVDPRDTVLPTGGLMGRISDRMKTIKEMADEMGRIAKGEKDKPITYTIVDPTAEKASYASRFNPKNEVHVKKAEALLNDPQIKGVYTEAEVKNAYDFEGLYQSHFDKGHVDVAVLLEQAGHHIPQMRASARSALLDLMKKEKGLPGAESGLKDFVNEVDFKYITEGGGGRAGDPINLMAKYFGKEATASLPKNATKENINKFTDFIMNAKDSRGRGINDPFFDRESIDFRTFEGFADELPPFKTGGRVGFKYGSRSIKGLLGLINKKFGKDTLKRASDVTPSTKYDDLKAVKAFEKRESIGRGRDVLKEMLAEDIESFRGKVDDNIIAELYAMEPGQQLKAIADVKEYILNMTKLRNMTKITQALGGGEDLSGVSPVYGEKYTEQLLRNWNPGKGRKPSASGGLAKILEV